MADIKDERDEPIKPCPPEECAKLAPRIGMLCHNNRWPAGHPVLIMQRDGQVCVCHCP